MASVCTPSVITSLGGIPGYKASGLVAIGAGNYVTGGITLNLNQPLLKASQTPLRVSITGVSGFFYYYIPGTNNSNGLIEIWVDSGTAQDPLVQLSAGAMPAGVVADTITYVAEYAGML